MNILIYGTGGVGGYFGARLQAAGNAVTFIARGAHLEALQNQGIQLKSSLGKLSFPVRAVATPPEEAFDLILIAVKGWQLETVAQSIRPIVQKNTLVLSLLNGAENADILRKHLPKEQVLAGLCKIVSKIEAPGIIHHFDVIPEIVFNRYDGKEDTAVQAIAKAFSEAGIKNKTPEQIHLAIWRKFLFICTISGMGALTRVPFGPMREDPKIRAWLYECAKEIIAVAQAKNIPLSAKDADRVMDFIDSMDYNTTASMQRDIMEGKPSELEAFNGYIVRTAAQMGISVPRHEMVYGLLVLQERGVRGE